MNNLLTKKISRSEKFFFYIINLISNDTAKAAALKRADNPSTEYQSWDILAKFGVDLTKEYERLIFALIAAAIVKAKITKNGSLGIGEAIAGCYDKNNQNDQAIAKLRRLLACDTSDELCLILRPLLQLINSKCLGALDFIKLLDDLLYFHFDNFRVKARWAQNFYYKKVAQEMINDS